MPKPDPEPASVSNVIKGCSIMTANTTHVSNGRFSRPFVTRLPAEQFPTCHSRNAMLDCRAGKSSPVPQLPLPQVYQLPRGPEGPLGCCLFHLTLLS